MRKKRVETIEKAVITNTKDLVKKITIEFISADGKTESTMTINVGEANEK